MMGDTSADGPRDGRNDNVIPPDTGMDTNPPVDAGDES
jgi:hypothetical protein